MSYESSESHDRDFPGLYRPAVGGDASIIGDEEHEKQVKKKDTEKKKKESRKEKKDKGYMMFEEEDSEEEQLVNMDDVKSPSKIKKPKPTFRFPKKDIFPKSKEKDEKKEKEGKKEEKKKDEKEAKRVKHKLKDKKKSKHQDFHMNPSDPGTAQSSAMICEKPVFGVPLAVAVERSKCHDGIELPAIFRECIDYIEEHGLQCEGIYRISGVKSKVQMLKEAYNDGAPAYLYEHEPNVVASLLKQFLRELPEPVLTTALMPKFEEASTIKNDAKCIEQFRSLIDMLPNCNRLLLSWMIVHMTHIIKRQKENKMSLQNVSIVLSPTMQISHRVLNVLFSHVTDLFNDTCIKKYIPPLKPATSRWSLELPDNLCALEEELAKQESLLDQLHEELNAGVEDALKNEQLWEVQRVVTQLKRKIKFARKAMEAAEKRKKEIEQQKRVASVHEEEELRLDLQEIPSKPIGDQEMVESEKTAPGVNPTLAEIAANAANEDAAATKTSAATDSQQITEQDVVPAANVPSVPLDEPTEGNAEVKELNDDDDINKNKPSKVEMIKQPDDNDPTVASAQVHVHNNNDITTNNNTVIDRPPVPSAAAAAEKSRPDFQADVEVYVPPEASIRIPTNINDILNETDFVFDEDLLQLLEEEEALKLEEEELLAISDELHQKIETEQSEIERLHQEIVELQYLRQDSDLDDMSSSSESSYESEDEDELQDILNQLIRDNELLEKKNTELCQKIHEERMICLDVKVRIRLLQQKQQDPSGVGGTSAPAGGGSLEGNAPPTDSRTTA